MTQPPSSNPLHGIVNLGAVDAAHRDSRHPAFIDVSLDGASISITHAGFHALADGVARGLLRRGLVRGDRIAVLSANRHESLALMLGAMRAGIVPVPVNYRFPAALIETVIADSGARLVVCDPERRPDCPAGLAAIVFGAAGPDGFDALIDVGPFDPIVPRPDEAALFLYTSGSTGRPKGVMLSHASHLWVVRVRMQGVDLASERYLIAAPLYHMNALALSLLALGAGATVVLLPQFQARAYLEAVGRHRCTWLTAVPPMIAMLLREKEALAAADLSSVRHLRMGSAPVSDRLAEQVRELLPRARIVNSYGTTEGGPVVFGPHPGGLPTPVESVGYPHPEVSVRLAPGATGSDANHGVLELRSPAIMLGYHARPDVPRPVTADGYYVTGDVFRRNSDGFYIFVGRSDDMFVSGGENIFPSEVETVLEIHPDVQQACVVPVDDEIKGTKPVAFVVLRPGATTGEEELKRHTLAHAPAFQHPRRIWRVEAMPLASTGKVDRAELRRLAEAAQPALEPGQA